MIFRTKSQWLDRRVALPQGLALPGFRGDLPVFTTLFVLTFAGVSGAADWSVSSAQGGVVRLVDGHWQELAGGEFIQDNQAVRTLRRGAAELELDGVRLSLSDETTIMIDRSGGAAGLSVSQYSGQVAISMPPGQDFALSTPGFSITGGSGNILVTVKGKLSKVQVIDGQAVIRSSNGAVIDLMVGDVAHVDGGDTAELVVTPAAENTNAASAVAGITAPGKSANAAAANKAGAGASSGNSGNSGNNGNNGNSGNNGSNGNGSAGQGKSGK